MDRKPAFHALSPDLLLKASRGAVEVLVPSPHPQLRHIPPLQPAMQSRRHVGNSTPQSRQRLLRRSRMLLLVNACRRGERRRPLRLAQAPFIRLYRARRGPRALIAPRLPQWRGCSVVRDVGI